MVAESGITVAAESVMALVAESAGIVSVTVTVAVAVVSVAVVDASGLGAAPAADGVCEQAAVSSTPAASAAASEAVRIRSS